MKTKIIILMIIMALLITGCSGKSKDKEIIVVDIHKGIGELEFDFMTNMPPDRLYSKEEYTLGIKLINKGSYDVRNGFVTLTGDPGYINVEGGLSTSKQLTQLTGKTNYDPRDSEQVVTFDSNIDFADTGFKEHSSNIVMTACYDYSNVFSTSICVDSDPYNLKAVEKTCTVKALNFQGQGGPVGISGVETTYSKKNDALYPRFKITISNFGKGELFTPGNSEAFCSSKNIKRETFNSITLKKLDFGDMILSDFECTPSNIVLNMDKAEIVCKLPEGSPKRLSDDTTTYTSQLSIEFDYGYSIAKSKMITVIQG